MVITCTDDHVFQHKVVGQVGETNLVVDRVELGVDRLVLGLVHALEVGERGGAARAYEHERRVSSFLLPQTVFWFLYY